MPTRGSTVPLEGTFQTTSGADVDATDVSVAIYHAEDLVAGPFTDVTHVTTGVYTRDWSIPLDVELGTYLAVWSGTIPGGTGPATGHEEFEVTSFFTAPGYSGCLWPLDSGCLGTEWDAFPEDVQARAHALASSTLRRLTAYRVGVCPITVRPMTKVGRCLIPEMSYAGNFLPFIGIDGVWRNQVCSGSPCEIELPAPISRIDSILIDGVEVYDPADFRIDNERLLVWQGDGDCPFPATQDINKPDTAPGTFSITYLNAYPVDAMGAVAAGTLAVEFAKACAGKGCKLPKGTTAVVRRGITIEVTPGMFPDGFTGLQTVDAYIALWNPAGLSRGPTVWSPDTPEYRVSR